jgi:hypothetical protein
MAKEDELITLTLGDLVRRVANYSSAVFVTTLIALRKDQDFLDLLTDPGVSDAEVSLNLGKMKETIAERMYQNLHQQLFEEN